MSFPHHKCPFRQTVQPPSLTTTLAIDVLALCTVSIHNSSWILQPPGTSRLYVNIVAAVPPSAPWKVWQKTAVYLLHQAGQLTQMVATPYSQAARKYRAEPPGESNLWRGNMLVELRVERSSDGHWDGEFDGRLICPGCDCMPDYVVMKWLPFPQQVMVFAAGRHV